MEVDYYEAVGEKDTTLIKAKITINKKHIEKLTVECEKQNDSKGGEMMVMVDDDSIPVQQYINKFNLLWHKKDEEVKENEKRKERLRKSEKDSIKDMEFEKITGGMTAMKMCKEIERQRMILVETNDDTIIESSWVNKIIHKAKKALDQQDFKQHLRRRTKKQNIRTIMSMLNGSKNSMM